jgi:hypothetical protein
MEEQKSKFTALRQTKNDRFILQDLVSGVTSYFQSGAAAIEAKLALDRRYAKEEAESGKEKG